METAKINNEPVYVMEDGKTVPYIPGHIKTARDGYAASLHLLFKHVADFHITVIDLLAEKYKFKAEEAINSLHADPRFRDMIVHPTIHAMGYFKEEEYKAVTKTVAQPSAVPLETPVTHEVPLPEAPKKKRTVVRKKKVSECKEVTEAEEAPQEVTPEQQAKLEELFGPESKEGEEGAEKVPEISENTIPEISTLSAREIALQKAKARAAESKAKKKTAK